MRKKLFKQLRLGRSECVTAGLTSHEHPAVSPDGRLLAYYAGLYGSIQVVVADIAGRFGRAVSPLGGNSTQPAWHPSGQLVAYRHQHANDSKWELWQTQLTGDLSPKVLLADDRFHYKHPYFSPAGLEVAYFSDEGSPGIYHLWLLDLAGEHELRVLVGLPWEDRSHLEATRDGEVRQQQHGPDVQVRRRHAERKEVQVDGDYERVEQSSVMSEQELVAGAIEGDHHLCV